MPLIVGSSNKDVATAITSATIVACDRKTRVPLTGVLYSGPQTVPPNAVGATTTLNDQTTPRVDPNNAAPFFGQEAIPFTLNAPRTFNGATIAIAMAAAVTAIEADIAAAILAAAIAGEVPGPRVRVLIGNDAKIIQVNVVTVGFKFSSLIVLTKGIARCFFVDTYNAVQPNAVGTQAQVVK